MKKQQQHPQKHPKQYKPTSNRKTEESGNHETWPHFSARGARPQRLRAHTHTHTHLACTSMISTTDSMNALRAVDGDRHRTQTANLQ